MDRPAELDGRRHAGAESPASDYEGAQVTSQRTQRRRTRITSLGDVHTEIQARLRHDDPLPEIRWRRAGVAIACAVAGLAVLWAGAHPLKRTIWPAGWHSQGGPVMRHVNVYAIFAGKTWSSGQGRWAQGWEVSFLRQMQAEGFTTILRQYGDRRGPGVPDVRVAGVWNDAGAGAIAGPSFGAAAREVRRAQALNGWPRRAAAGRDQLYIVFSGRRAGNNIPYCGYHDSAPGNKVEVATVVNPQTAACNFGDSADSLTLVSFHEIAESITDPNFRTAGWIRVGSWPLFGLPNTYLPEIADVCQTSNSVIVSHNYLVQKVWDLSRHRCGSSAKPDRFPAPAFGARRGSGGFRYLAPLGPIDGP